jgi:hypothetical protein
LGGDEPRGPRCQRLAGALGQAARAKFIIGGRKHSVNLTCARNIHSSLRRQGTRPMHETKLQVSIHFIIHDRYKHQVARGCGISAANSIEPSEHHGPPQGQFLIPRLPNRDMDEARLCNREPTTRGSVKPRFIMGALFRSRTRIRMGRWPCLASLCCHGGAGWQV